MGRRNNVGADRPVVRHVLAAVFCVVALLAGVVPTAATEPRVGVHTGTTPTELQIARFYRAVLDREPDEAGMAYWYRLLTTGTDVTTIADSFAVSTEFEARFGVSAGASGDPEFLRQVYRNVLDRDPDLAGERYWAQLLAAGVPRAQVVLWFSESQEFLSASGLAPADLPPFESEVLEITADDLGVSWRPGCPVSPRDLRLLRLRFVDFAGSARDGELVVHTDVAEDIVIVFERLYLNRYPIESMRTVDEFGGSDDASMAANNTSAFNCRAAVSSTSWSRHAYGTAIDFNPLINPYVTSSTVLPPTGADFADRLLHHPAVIREGDIVVRSFDAIGWSWGGRWRTVKDYQHFSLSGR